jgi:DNA-binding IclR family transcriptional regulator
VKKLSLQETDRNMVSGGDMPEVISQRKSIQSVEIGARVLISLLKTDPGGSFLRDVASHSGLSRSQAHRYLLAFVNAGMVEQDASSGRYSLGTLAVRLGLAAIATLDPVRIATRHLEGLLKELHTTGLLSVWGDYGPTVIRWIDGGIPLFTSMHVGSILPLQGSSTGSLFLTYCPPAQTRGRIERERAEGIIVKDADLSKEIESVRKLGYARTYGSVVPGLAAVSVPVFDSQNCLVATMSVLARSQDKAYFSQAKIAQIVKVAQQAGEAIGWPGPA